MDSDSSQCFRLGLSCLPHLRPPVRQGPCFGMCTENISESGFAGELGEMTRFPTIIGARRLAA